MSFVSGISSSSSSSVAAGDSQSPSLRFRTASVSSTPSSSTSSSSSSCSSICIWVWRSFIGGLLRPSADFCDNDSVHSVSLGVKVLSRVNRINGPAFKSTTNWFGCCCSTSTSDVEMMPSWSPVSALLARYSLRSWSDFSHCNRRV